MKFTLSWLKDHLDTAAPLARIVETLTRIGLEVERVDNPAARLAGFVVARVIEAKPHPNADRLRVCMVDVGNSAPVQVVCGAPNARAGMRGVFSPVGTFIPGKKITLAKGVIRGVESNGMLCSGAELELSDDHDGIIDLADDAPVGLPYATYAGLDDPIIEINLTPNRPDATGVSGIARDLAAAGLGELKTQAPASVPGAFDCPVNVTLDLSREDAHLCPAFALRLVRGVHNGASEWMQKRLRAIGLRPINALVDITNYVTFDRGRPLHVFDAAKVAGPLHVRRARAGESVLALDGKTYTLDESMVVIADDRSVESIAGIIGGEHSGCDESTTDVLIECALWDPLNIAQTGRKLGVSTDARYRFERGVDPAFCVPGAELATQMTLDLCGGDASRLIVVGPGAKPAQAIDFPPSEVARLTGLEIARAEGEAILCKLGFTIDGAKATPPSWRPDIEVKADIVEQIVRIAGLDRVERRPLQRLAPGVPAPVLTLLQKRTRLAQRTLASLGLREAVTWSFISKSKAVLFGGGAPALSLANPIAADLSDMRPSLVPGLAAAADRNARRGQRDIGLFEVGQIFIGEGDQDQRVAAAALRRGRARSQGSGRHWAGGGGPVDAFDAKSDALALLGALGVSLAAAQVIPGGPGFLHPGRSATLRFGPGNVIGWFGQLHPDAAEAFGAEDTLVAFEIILDRIPAPKLRSTRARAKLERPEFMAVERDLAFVVARDVAAADIVKAALAAERGLIAGAQVFDVYEGQGVPNGHKSVAIAVTLQPHERTLTDAEIESTVDKIVAEVAKRTGAALRG